MLRAKRGVGASQAGASSAARIGAAVWASAAPLISAYASASSSERVHIDVTFATVVHAVAALWHYLTGPTVALWLASVAVATRSQWRGFASFSMVLAVAAAVGSIGAVLLPDATSSGPAALFFAPLAAWAVWLGVRIWRDVDPAAG